MVSRVLKAFAIAVFVVLVLGTVTASATPTLRADIPFAFTVGNAELPAGVYTVTQLAAGAYVIRNQNQRQDAAMVLASSLDTTNPQGESKLVFLRSGNSYSLEQLRTFGGNATLSAGKRSAADATTVVAVVLH